MTDQKPVVLVARDLAVSQALAKVKNALEELCYPVRSFLGMGESLRASMSDIMWAVEGAAVLLTGMSAFEQFAQEELAALRAAVVARVPCGLYTDKTSTCTGKEWLRSLEPHIQFFFAPSKPGMEAAQARFEVAQNRGAEIILSGNPLVEDWFFPRYTRACVRRMLGILSHEHMVLATGGRSLAVNLLHLSGLIAATRRHSLDGRQLHLVYSPHPGDENDPIVYAQLAADTMGQTGMSTRILISERHLTHKMTGPRWTELHRNHQVCMSRLSGEEAIPGADLLVLSASTLGQTAAAQRIPVVDYFTTLALHRLKYEGVMDHEDCALGISEAADVDSPKDLAEVMALLLDPASPTRLRQRKNQEEHYPHPMERGGAIRAMTETLVRYGYGDPASLR